MDGRPGARFGAVQCMDAYDVCVQDFVRRMRDDDCPYIDLLNRMAAILWTFQSRAHLRIHSSSTQ